MAAPTPATQTPYPTTGTTNSSNKTTVSLSTMIILMVDDTPIGAIQDLQVNEQRTIEMIDELGYDGHVDSAPSKSTEISGSCSRVRLDGLRIAEAFNRGFIHVKSQRVPFEIRIIDTMNGDLASGSAVVTVIKDVWLESISYKYDAKDWIIVDNMNWKAEDIYSYVSGNDSPVAQGGMRKLPNIAYDAYELAADVGLRGGAMDSPDLIHAPLRA